MIFDFYPRASVLTPLPVLVGGRVVMLVRGRNELDCTTEQLRAALQPAGLVGAVRTVRPFSVEASHGPAPAPPSPEASSGPLEASSGPAPVETPPEASSGPLEASSGPAARRRSARSAS